ncbi:MAG: hypothetical protein DCC75_05980 [Proteobacteria bacterium]|nr:MAG: hypothetical protein DCC75_05980 [Pseudomonadota bacterium]
MHQAAHLDINHLMEAQPLKFRANLRMWMWMCVMVGVMCFGGGLVYYPAKLFWGSFYVNLWFWTGLACGGVMATAIFQIVRAKWSPPIRRIAEANVAFLPYAFIGFLATYAGRGHLFPWANQDMPGKTWWMQPDFVYARFTLLLAFLFFLMWRFVRMSLRSDVGVIRERAKSNERYLHPSYDGLVKGWQGEKQEVIAIQRRLSWNAPALVIAYALIYSLFVFEMLMGMDPIWYSNLFAAFILIGNIYLAWSVIAFTSMRIANNDAEFSKVLTSQQLWDLGKLNFGFCMLWGYMFFSQFLTQWYGNLPEETAWMIVRTREMPWMGLGWVVFSLCFVVPFILLLSRDLKRTPRAYSAVAMIVFLGIWLEKYVIIMPNICESMIALGFLDLGLFLGFLGAYVLSIQGFLSRYPFVPFSHPLARGSVEW